MVETAITDAKTRHRLFLDAQARHGIEHSPEDKYIWLPSLAIGKADPSTEYEKRIAPSRNPWADGSRQNDGFEPIGGHKGTLKRAQAGAAPRVLPQLLANSTSTRDAEPLPDGWISMPSQSRPGQLAYEHVSTGTRSVDVPTIHNQQNFIEQWAAIYPPVADRPVAQPLPDGRMEVPSRTQPGQVRYKHNSTGARTAELPTSQNQRELIDRWMGAMARAMVRGRSSSNRSVDTTWAAVTRGNSARAQASSRRHQTTMSRWEGSETRNAAPSPYVYRGRSSGGARAATQAPVHRNNQAVVGPSAFSTSGVAGREGRSDSDRRGAAAPRGGPRARIISGANPNPMPRFPGTAGRPGNHFATTTTATRPQQSWEATSSSAAAAAPAAAAAARNRVRTRSLSGRRRGNPTSGGAPTEAVNDESSTSSSYSSDWDSDVYSTDAEYNAGSRSATVVTSATDTRPPAEVGSAERVHDDGSMFDDDNGNDNDDDQSMFDDDESMFDDNASTGGNVADNNESDNESNATVDDNDSPATAENIEDDNGDESARTVDEDNIARTASILNRGANDDDLHVPKELLEDFCCPISLMTMTDPVIAADGFCYDRSSIKKWMRQHDFSPMSGKPLSSYEVTTNYHLRSMVNKWAHALPDASLLLSRQTTLRRGVGSSPLENERSQRGGAAAHERNYSESAALTDEESGSDEEHLYAPSVDYKNRIEGEHVRTIFSFSVGKTAEVLQRNVEKDDFDKLISSRQRREAAQLLDKPDPIDTSKSFLEDSTTYHVLEVLRPVDIAPVDTEGIFIWFQPGSLIEVERPTQVNAKPYAGDTPRVAFYEYDSGGRGMSGEFGRSLNQKQAKELYECDQRRCRMYGKLRDSFVGFSGTPDDGLPSIDKPLYVKSLSCVMALHCPQGFTRPSFTVCASYTQAPQLQLFRTKFMRHFNWACNTSIFACTCIIVLLDAYGVYAFVAFLLIALVQVVGNALSKIYWVGYCKY